MGEAAPVEGLPFVDVTPQSVDILDHPSWMADILDPLSQPPTPPLPTVREHAFELPASIVQAGALNSWAVAIPRNDPWRSFMQGVHHFLGCDRAFCL